MASRDKRYLRSMSAWQRRYHDAVQAVTCADCGAGPAETCRTIQRAWTGANRGPVGTPHGHWNSPHAARRHAAAAVAGRGR